MTEFNTDDPIAFFLTWTTYGTWLPGDERGWHQKSGGPRDPNQLFEEMSQRDLKETPFVMTAKDREIVNSTIHKHCGIRNWCLHAVNARSNHVHVVVAAPDYHPETVRDQFKAWCTRELKPYHPGRERLWTEGASVRWINNEADLETVIVYTNEAQDRKGVELD